MYHISGQIQGVAPLLLNRWADTHSLDSPGTGGRLTMAQRLQEAEDKLYRNGEGRVCARALWLKRCLITGASRAGLKRGRASAVPTFTAAIFVEGDLIPFADPDGKPYKEADFIDERVGRRPPRTGGAMLIRRPGLHIGWQLPFRIIVTDDRIDDGQLRTALEEAGLLVGFCEYRPEFGRFIVTTWQREG